MAKTPEKMDETELRKYVADLERKNETLHGQVQELEQGKALDISADARQGYLVRTPNVAFSGVTAGVQFSAGRGFVPGERKSDPGVDRLLRKLENDFHYQVLELDDNGVAELRNESDMTQQINASLAGKIKTRDDMKLEGKGVPLHEALQPGTVK